VRFGPEAVFMPALPGQRMKTAASDRATAAPLGIGSERWVLRIMAGTTLTGTRAAGPCLSVAYPALHRCVLDLSADGVDAGKVVSDTN